MKTWHVAMIGAAGAAVAAAGWSAAPSAAPVATYWMDVTTQSGMGGISEGGQPDMASVMAMMSGNTPPPSYMLRLRLASKTPAPAAAKADHLIPPVLRMGASLPLVTPARAAVEPGEPVKPQGRLLIYWGCGDHVSAGQPMVINVADMAAGKVPESVKRMGAIMGRNHRTSSGPFSAPGFGEWPNPKDLRAVPPGASLLGAHRVEGNYSPPIDFTLAAGQDFMGPLNLAEAGMTPAGAAQVRWSPVTRATGYALASFGANEAGDTIMWSSVKTAGMANLDYLSPGDVTRAVASGDVLGPSVTQCIIPAEVVRAMPMGAAMGIAYGPEVHFAEAPKNPKWTVTVRYKASGMLMRGMAGMMGE